jgi:RHS repeat-associated protein
VLTGRSIDSHYASVDSAGNIAFGIGDTLGSTVGVTNSTGAITSKLDYEPYGHATGTVPTTYPFAYTGRVPVLGDVYYYRNRFYDDGTGRFLSEDPIGVAGGANPYAYVRNDPINRLDPAGLSGLVDLLLYAGSASKWKAVSQSSAGIGLAQDVIKANSGQVEGFAGVALDIIGLVLAPPYALALGAAQLYASDFPEINAWLFGPGETAEQSLRRISTQQCRVH